MVAEPQVKRAVAFFDGQNLFHAVREAFGYTYPNYSPLLLASRVCADCGYSLQAARFYTGVPDASDNPFWNSFWTAKLLAMSRTGVAVFSRPLRYRNKTIRDATGNTLVTLVGEEKGIDVRIALDVIRIARQQQMDVALIFSQDQDLSEVATEIRSLAREQGRWIKIASAFPESPTSRNRRGINHTDWIKVSRSTYDACLDPRDYRPKGSFGGK